MWHHFAFMAVSLGMFGTTVGAMCIFLTPHFFHERLAPFNMGVSSLLLATCIVGSILILMGVRFVPEIYWESLDALTFIYVVAAIPFVFSGLCIGLVLTRYPARFPSRVGTLYAADLVGPAVGRRVLGIVIGMTDGITTAFAICLAGSDRFCLLPGP